VKKHVLTLLKYGLGIALLAWVVWRYWDSTPNGPGLGEALQKPIQWLPFALAVMVYLVGILITFYRWYVLVRAQDLPFTVVDAMRLGLIGFYLSTFLPGSVGGDLIKAAFIARQQSRRTVAVATVVVDRVIGLCGLFWLVACVGGVAWFGGYIAVLAKDADGVAFLQTIVLTTIGVSAGSFATWFVAGFVPAGPAERFAQWLHRIYKIGGLLAELWRALYMYRRRGRSVLASVVMSMGGHICFVLAFYFSSLTLNDPDKVPSMVAHFLLVPVGMTITSAVPTPGGVGGAEVAFGVLYGLAGYDPANGVLASLVQRVITWMLGLMGYLVYLRMKPSLPHVRPEETLTDTVEAGQPVAK
jgi:glycosyltransferase 2 family protein